MEFALGEPVTIAPDFQKVSANILEAFSTWKGHFFSLTKPGDEFKCLLGSKL